MNTTERFVFPYRGRFPMNAFFSRPMALSSLIAGVLISATPAKAGLARAWVSGNGIDSPGCGLVTSPCRQIKYVLDNNLVNAGGEIDVFSPSGFAPFSINQSVSIIGAGAGTASIQQATSGAIAIDIQAGPNDAIVLQGLDIDGAGVGNMGIRITKAGSVSIMDCVVKRFAYFGLSTYGTSLMKVAISDSLFSDNDSVGIYFQPSSDLLATLTRVTINNSNGGSGLTVGGAYAPATAKIIVSAVDSVFSNNGGHGVDAWGSSTTGRGVVSLDNVTVTGNGAEGLFADASGGSNGGVISVSRSIVAGNGWGAGVASGAAIYTSRNNAFRDNRFGDLNGGSLTPFTTQ
jgi:hypothetical protein